MTNADPEPGFSLCARARSMRPLRLTPVYPGFFGPASLAFAPQEFQI
jgi:hypothetical protein